ncbi:hypothetical protein Tco_0681714 [Tanacetum coccineum]|uniref:Uncharacterized protein n=1 Tax=Tanacetum coccineum TaxID=301880 RepID=A0ABQ4XQQ8_9ASTR
MIPMTLRLVFLPWRGVTDWYQSHCIFLTYGLLNIKDPEDEAFKEEPLEGTEEEGLLEESHEEATHISYEAKSTQAMPSISLSRFYLER